jgi:NADH dehydrogenase
VFVTGATGFVGKSVVRTLLAKGYTPVCLVRSPSKLRKLFSDVDPSRLVAVVGDLSDRKALQQAADLSQAAIHLVGIIIARPLRGQTFTRVHVSGTKNVLAAVTSAGINRYVHMSALGSRPGAHAKYHQTKWEAEELVRASGLNWTIFRPSVVHGPDGEFMQLMKRFMCGLIPPIIPYFGSGDAKIQPVSVKDVAHCFVSAIETAADSHHQQVYSLGGPRAYSWREFYNTCRTLMPGAKRWKPMVSLPTGIAKFNAIASAPVMGFAETLAPSLGLFRFDVGQVQMSQEDSICDQTVAEQAFDLKMRSFEDELAFYADQIR